MPADWSGLAGDVAAAAGPLERAVALALAACSRPHPRQFPLLRSDWYGSSLNFTYELRAYHPNLLVPEHDVLPAFGAQTGWDPRRERPPADPDRPCPECGGRFAPPEPTAADPRPERTHFVCPACQGSGWDDRLAHQKALAGLPPPHREPGPAGANPRGGAVVPGRPAPPTRRSLRAAQFGTPAAAPDGLTGTASPVPPGVGDASPPESTVHPETTP